MQSKTTTFALAALCVLLAAFLIGRGASDNAEMSRLTARVATLTHELAVVKQTPAPVPPPAEPPKQTIPAPKPVAEFTPRTVAAATFKLNEDLAAARLRISDLESKILSVDADRATLAQQRRQELVAAEETCRAKTSDTLHLLETAQTDLKSAQQRMALFESENENLRKAQAAALKIPAHPSVPDPQLDEISRRRDTYLKSLLRRYREIDNDYRIVLRDPAGPRTTDPAMLRIQATLSQAEEDLRQIDSLNAKTLLVEKRQEKN